MNNIGEIGGIKSIIPEQMSGVTSVAAQKAGSGASVAGIDGTGFGNALKNALENVNEAQVKSKETALRLQMDDPTVSVEDIAIASNEASLKFQTLVATRTRIMQAYSEIMSMPV